MFYSLLTEDNMKSFTYKCLPIAEVCEYNDLALMDVMDAICDSDISFGTNYDTIISHTQLESILEDAGIAIDGLDYNNHDADGLVLIALGS
jgi:hypothetical protein